MVTTSRRSVAVIGAGPAGLAAAEVLATHGLAVTIYERMASPARKLLMAGRGGLNLTHSEPLDAFVQRYPGAPPPIEAAIRSTSPARLIDWAHGLGQETFVGSSGRVFPKRLKASPLLRAWLARLATLGVVMRLNHRWNGWTEAGELCFATPAGPHTVAASAVVLALGGASWPKLGSDGQWAGLLAARGVTPMPFAPSNCGVVVPWSDRMQRHQGQPLKRIAVTVDGQLQRGELVVTRDGLQGGAIYALGPQLRRRLADAGQATAVVDLRPDTDLAALAARLVLPRGKQSTATVLRKQLKLAPAAIGLLHEAAAGPLPKDAAALATLIKAVPVPVVGLSGLERAISSVGGLPLAAVDDRFMIRALPGVFAAGEMLDWDAPTGGYLLQACFATGIAAAQGILAYLGERSVPAEHDTAAP
jgi:uncharacterized flavoprotein (TIGR03862 family)